MSISHNRAPREEPRAVPDNDRTPGKGCRHHGARLANAAAVPKVVEVRRANAGRCGEGAGGGAMLEGQRP
jgi:hypothetical protein